MNKLEFIIQFIIGGFIITGAIYVIKYLGIKKGAIFYSVRYTLFPLLFLMWYHDISNKKIALFSKHSAYTLIIFCIFLYLFYIILDEYLYNYKYGMFYALGISFLFWFISIYIYDTFY